MSIRRQFVLDKKSNRILDQLALDRGGNRSHVVREALQVLAEREAYLEQIESDPAFIKMMEQSEKSFREGRVVTQEELEAELRRAKAKKRRRA
jgi:predicted transcriptional regulator